MDPQTMMGGRMGMGGQPPAGGQPGMLLSALMGGGDAGIDSMGGDELPQVLLDFPMQPPAPTPDDGMMLGGFPGGNMQGQGAQMDPNMLALLMQPPGGPSQGQPGLSQGQPPMM